MYSEVRSESCDMHQSEADHIQQKPNLLPNCVSLTGNDDDTGVFGSVFHMCFVKATESPIDDSLTMLAS